MLRTVARAIIFENLYLVVFQVRKKSLPGYGPSSKQHPHIGNGHTVAGNRLLEPSFPGPVFLCRLFIDSKLFRPVLQDKLLTLPIAHLVTVKGAERQRIGIHNFLKGPFVIDKVPSAVRIDEYIPENQIIIRYRLLGTVAYFIHIFIKQLSERLQILFFQAFIQHFLKRTALQILQLHIGQRIPILY